MYAGPVVALDTRENEYDTEFRTSGDPSSRQEGRPW
jgi:hypothetical protein